MQEEAFEGGVEGKCGAEGLDAVERGTGTCILGEVEGLESEIVFLYFNVEKDLIVSQLSDCSSTGR